MLERAAQSEEWRRKLEALGDTDAPPSMRASFGSARKCAAEAPSSPAVDEDAAALGGAAVQAKRTLEGPGSDARLANLKARFAAAGFGGGERGGMQSMLIVAAIGAALGVGGLLVFEMFAPGR